MRALCSVIPGAKIRFKQAYHLNLVWVSNFNTCSQHSHLLRDQVGHSKKEVAGRKNSSGSASTKKVCHGCDLRAMWRPNSGSGFQPLQRRLSSLRHFSGIPTQPELLTTLTCFKGRTLCHCEERKRRSNLDRKDCFASLAMTRSHLWGVATILANTFFRECTLPDITRLLRRNAPRNDNLSVAGPTSI